MNSKPLVWILISLLLASCRLPTGDHATAHWKAVYLAQGPGELSPEDLQAHGQVLVVPTFDELKKNAKQKVALWIDKNATPFDSVQEEWINAAPQAYYPLVLIGTSDTLHAFRDLLRLRGFMGPAGNYPGRDAPGFSVIVRAPPARPKTDLLDIPFMHGYDQKPTVQSILAITSDFLEGNIRPIPISTLPKPPIEIPTSAIRPILLYDDWPSAGFPDDAAKINWVSLGGNILTIDAAYQGNCQEHAFQLYAANAFLESNPQQALLYLAHDSHGDTCTQNVEQELSFDLTPLDKSRTGRHANPLLLRIYEPAGGSFVKEPVLLIEWP